MDDVFLAIAKKWQEWIFRKICKGILYHFLVKNVEVGNWSRKIFPREKIQPSKISEYLQKTKKWYKIKNHQLLENFWKWFD